MVERVALQLAATAAFLIGCQDSTAVRPPEWLGCGPIRVEVADDIREAAVRYLIDPPDGCLQRPVSTVRPELVYCLGFDGASDDWCHMFQCDSDPSLMSRFAAERRAVVPLSACSLGYPTTDVPTGRRAAVITTGDLCWLGPTRVEVEAAYHFGLGSDMSFRLQLRQSVDKWVVDICEITGVS